MLKTSDNSGTNYLILNEDSGLSIIKPLPIKIVARVIMRMIINKSLLIYSAIRAKFLLLSPVIF